MSDTTTIEITFEGIEIDENADYTCYKIAAFANKLFELNNFNKVIPPTMMYNYNKNGLITKGTKNAKTYKGNEVVVFLTKYVTRTIRK